MLCASLARAQCAPAWLPVSGLPGIERWVTSAVVWDPDADGPRHPVAVFGGLFNAAGTVAANGVALFDGQSWAAMPRLTNPGSSGYPSVGALFVYRGELCVGGSNFFVEGRSTSIARWDGEAWRNFGTGVVGSVSAICEHEGRLIAAGTISSAGGTGTSGIAAWNPDASAWELFTCGLGGSVEAVASFAGHLYGAGSFTSANCTPTRQRLVRWDGVAWRSVGPGLDVGTPRDLLVHDGKLHIGGSDLGVTGGLAGATVLAWDGAAFETIHSTAGWSINALALHEGALCAAGSVSGGGSVRGPPVRRRTGPGVWSTIGGDQSSSVYAMVSYNGELLAGGIFQLVFPGASGFNVARWNGASWQALGEGFNGSVLALASRPGNLAVGGNFSTVDDLTQSSLANWDGASLTPLGPPFLRGTVRALAAFGTELIIGGSSNTLSDGQSLYGLGAWNGAAWRRLDDSTDSSRIVRVLRPFTNELFVAGTSNLSGGLAGRIARLAGSSLAPLGQGTNGEIFAVTEHNGELVVAGGFSTAGGAPANSIAAWNGAAWRTLGNASGATNGNVFALASFRGELYAGGAFTTMAGVSARGLARWDGNTWRPVEEPRVFGFADAVYALALYRGDLIVAGDFEYTSTINSPNIVRWNGAAWRSMAGGIDSTPLTNFSNASVYALAVHEDDLFVGGNFLRAGSVFSPCLLRWRAGSPPTILAGPSDYQGCRGEVAPMSVTADTSTGTLRYAWRKDGQPLRDRNMGGPPSISGSTTPNLYVSNLRPADAGRYECLVSSDCGTTLSAAATLTLCDADLDNGSGTGVCDGGVEITDLLFFLSMFALGDSRADLDNGSGAGVSDGGVTIDDLLYYLARFDAGC